LRLWDADGNPLATLSGHTDGVDGAQELSDGRILSRSWDDTLRLWDADGNPLATLSGHTSGSITVSNMDYIIIISYSVNMQELSDGRILSWSGDNTLRLWDADGEPLTTLSGHRGSVAGAQELSDGRILSWGEDASLRIWQDYPNLHEYACTRVFRDLTYDERVLYNIRDENGNIDLSPTCPQFEPITPPQ
ncbi:MAG: hypothetical protein KJ043_11545, partial [Anaerolineae bacterium]|nr:hypothetical protein [Anaerolineae bacterium]